MYNVIKTRFVHKMTTKDALDANADNIHKKRKTTVLNFNVYLYKILKTLKENVAITKEGICMLDNFLHHLGNKMERGLNITKKFSKTKTITINDFYSTLVLYIGYQAAVPIHQKAMAYVETYENFVIKKKEMKELAAENGETGHYKPIQQNIKAGLNISVSRVEGVFMKNYSRISKLSMIYFTAVLECLLTEILKQTFIIVEKLHKQRIKTSHLKMAIQSFNMYKEITGNAIYPLL